MKIKIWNAFASNNSGSYTIVGNFPNVELAKEVAAELTAVVSAHDVWIRNDKRISESPLEILAKTHNLRSFEPDDNLDEWPEYSDDTRPKVLAINHQVVIHHDYTVTLPALFGQYFYVRGGRVNVELNHSHYPIVAIFTLTVDYSMRHKIDLHEKFSHVIAELTADTGPLSVGLIEGHEAAWKIMGRSIDSHLVVGACFEVLLDSFCEVEKIASKHELYCNVAVFEAFSHDKDPLSHLRT
ncbi:MAG: hypothetical protein WCT03_17495 [Candidatus Obscuribacterales bacterium]|jgi:hypothetical protein